MHTATEIQDQCCCQQLLVRMCLVQHDVLRKTTLQQLQFIQPMRRRHAMSLQDLGQQRMERLQRGADPHLHACLARPADRPAPLVAEGERLAERNH